MGRKLDALLGRGFKTKKFKATVNLAMSRLTVLKNQHHARLTIARSDIIQLLNLNHHEHALLRVGEVVKEQNMLDVFVMVDGYCRLLLQMVKLLEKERYCPDELKEPVSSLIFAAPRCGEFPELQEIRAILTARYGKEFKFAHGDIELRNSCGVNATMVQKLSPRRPSLEARIKTLQEIAIENDIVLKLGDTPPDLKEGDDESTNSDIPRTSSALDFDDVLSFTESIKGKKIYKGVEDAAHAAFESAAYAAVAARAAMELSRSQSTGFDNTDSPGSQPRHVLGSIPNESKSLMKLEKTQEIEFESESESESEPEPEPEPVHEGEISKNGVDIDKHTPLDKVTVLDESDNEIESKTTHISSSKQKEFDIGNNKLRFEEVLKMQQPDLTKRPIIVRSF